MISIIAGNEDMLRYIPTGKVREGDFGILNFII